MHVENYSRGDEVEDLLEEYDLAILINVGNTPTFRQTKDGQITESIIHIRVINIKQVCR